jgi:hypothetical protein
MTTIAIVLPSLTDWTEGRLSALIEAKTQRAFDEAFDNFLAKEVVITVNGVQVSRDDYKTRLQEEGALHQRSASVKFDNAVEQQESPETGALVRPRFLRIDELHLRDDTDAHVVSQAGNVGVFYDATISKEFLVFGAPAQSKVTSSMNVV